MQSLDQEDLLQKEMASHSSILPGELHVEKTGRLHLMGSQRVEHN